MMRIVLTALCLCTLCFGQENKANPQQAKYYKLDFTVKEINGGKLVNSRSYSLSVVTGEFAGRPGEVRAGEKIPYQTAAGPSSIDVGVNIDVFNAKEVGDRLAMTMSGEISSVSEPSQNQSLPVTRQSRMNTYALIPLRKATTIFSADEPFSKGQLQIEVTATPLN